MCSRMPHFIHKLQQVWGFHHQRRKRNFCPDISTSGRQIPDFQDGYRDPNWVTTMHIAVHVIGILGWTMVEWMTLQSTRKQPSIKPASSPRNQHQLLPTSSWNRNWIRMRMSREQRSCLQTLLPNTTCHSLWPTASPSCASPCFRIVRSPPSSLDRLWSASCLHLFTRTWYSICRPNHFPWP